MNPVFYQYRLENNILDNLIEEFKKRSWFFEEMPSGYFHKFKWPDIVLSNKEPLLTLPDLGNVNDEYPHTIELLGCYAHDDNPEKEGKIILYMLGIQKTALDFGEFKTNCPKSSFTDDQIKYFIESLTTLILIHEFTHWVFHAGTFKLSSKIARVIDAVKYNDEDSINYHETLAQIFTNYFCQQYSELSELFIWLENKQPGVYKQYRKLISEKEDGYINVSEDIIQRVVFSVMLMEEEPKYKKQSFNELKEIYVRFNTQDINGFFSNPNDFLNKYRGTITGKKFGV